MRPDLLTAIEVRGVRHDELLTAPHPAAHLAGR